MSAPTPAAAAPAEGGLKKCTYCKQWLETSAFTFKKDRDPQKRCEPCRIKGNASANKSVNRAEVNARHRQTDLYAASQARHRATDLHAATEKRWRNGPVGQARAARTNVAKKQRREDDPSFREKENVHRLADAICRRKTESSATFLAKTGWTAEELRAHLEERFTAGMTWANFGTFWNLDHRIPQSAFSFPDETKKCCCAENVRPLSKKENKKKQDKLLDEEILRVPVAAWPAWFGGRIPTETEKQAVRAAQGH